MKIRHSRRRIGNALIAGALTLGAGAGTAAAQPVPWFDAAADGATGVVAAELDDDALHRFIDAVHDVEAVRRDYAGRIERAGVGERAALLAEAQERMASAVERNGLGIADYRRIGYLLETDEHSLDRFDRKTGRSATG